jgi:hypothetical protein
MSIALNGFDSNHPLQLVVPCRPEIGVPKDGRLRHLPEEGPVRLGQFFRIIFDMTIEFV